MTTIHKYTQRKVFKKLLVKIWQSPWFSVSIKLKWESRYPRISLQTASGSMLEKCIFRPQLIFSVSESKKFERLCQRTSKRFFTFDQSGPEMDTWCMGIISSSEIYQFSNVTQQTTPKFNGLKHLSPINLYNLYIYILSFINKAFMVMLFNPYHLIII